MIKTAMAEQIMFKIAKAPVQFWGAALLVILFSLGLALFVTFKLLPLFQQHAALRDQLVSTRSGLAAAEELHADLPRRLQAQLATGQTDLEAAAGKFLSKAQAADALNRLYAYSSAAGVEIVELQSQPGVITDTFSVETFALRAVGLLDQQFNFLTRMQEIAQPGFVVSHLAIAQEPPAGQPAPDQAGESPPVSETRYSLSMNIALYISPYAPSLPSASTPIERTAPVQLSTVPATDGLGGLRQSLQAAWQNNAWEEAIRIAQQMLASTPGQPNVIEYLYRAHLNFGYHLLTAHRVEEARLQFNQARSVKPDGQEAHIELEQLDTTSVSLFAAEQQMIRELQLASAVNNWPEVIRLLRLLQVVNPNFPHLAEQLSQAHIRYADQLTAEGKTDLAQEQRQQAQQILAGR